MSNYKQAIIVRKDLGMGTGKIAGQVAHAAVQAAHKIRIYNYEWYNSWLYDDDPPQTKIVLKVNSSSELIKFTHEIPLNYLAFIHDAGKTQIEPNTLTCIGIGPLPNDDIDPIIKDLKLL
jgi:peptidyl-tRNA hydrolase, PTH2 family